MMAGVLITLITISNPALAESRHDAIPFGPKIGTQVSAFLDNVSDQEGTRQSLQTLRGKKGLILLFSRSFDW
jgi:hypothetical protein